jgi:hypothetical protein
MMLEEDSGGQSDVLRDELQRQHLCRRRHA